MEEKSKIIETDQKLINYAFPKIRGIDLNKIKVTNISPYSVTGNLIGFKLIKLVIKYMGTSRLIITDMTANVGSDSLKFGMKFDQVNSIEYDSLTCDLLKYNINLYKLEHKINVICGDSSKEIKNLRQDVLYMDPPWGGASYSEQDQMDLKLGNQDIVDIIIENLHLAKLFVIKCPKNYNFNKLLHKLAPFNVYIHAIKRKPIEEGFSDDEQHIKMQFIFIYMGNYFTEGLKKYNQIRVIYDIIFYRDLLIKILKSSEKEMKRFIKQKNTDLEIYLYFHNKFKKTEDYKNYDENKIKHLRRMYDQKVKFLVSFLDVKNKEILDVGTEDDYFLKLFLKNGAKSINGINVGSLDSYRGKRDLIKIYDGINIPFDDNKFDIITIMMSVHHFSCYEETLKEIKRVLKPNGKLLIHDHNFNNELTNAYIDIYHFIFELVQNKKYNVDYYNNYDTKYISREELSKTLNRLGFKEEKNKILQRKYSHHFNALKKYYSLWIKKNEI